MRQLATLEDGLVKAFKDMPHLPVAVRDWLVDNA